ncbi:MAG: hypothetical protein OEW75_08585 [Cyclobacteriaceae bacterium]|nr:hypothetical protein [Cyclobacteriaceae bacterium]
MKVILKYHILIITLSVLNLFGCISENKSHEKVEEKVGQVVVLDNEQKTSLLPTVESNSDSLYLLSQLNALEGIEKFAVGGNHFLLLALLEKKGLTSEYEKVKEILERGTEEIREFVFYNLDTKNGYAQFAPMGTEVTYTLVYWNKEDGSQLIAYEDFSCGPICDSEISFRSYHNGVYSNLKSIDVIPDIINLPLMLNENYNPNSEDPYEFRFVLPQKGKNIKFCEGEKCLELIWMNGIFKVLAK